MVCQNAELLYESSGKVQFLHFATILSICRIPRKCLGQSNYYLYIPLTGDVSMQVILYGN